MTTPEYSLVRLFPDSTQAIVDHIQSLNDRDRYLRFGYNCPVNTIASYVAGSIDTVNTQKNANFWFGIKQGDVLIATLHVAIGDDAAEFAFTTAEEHRGRKLGQLMFARGYQLVTEYSISRVYMCCLSENKAMRHIAKKFGLAVMTQGSDSEGSVNIQYPVSLKQVHLVKSSIIDKNIFL